MFIAFEWLFCLQVVLSWLSLVILGILGCSLDFSVLAAWFVGNCCLLCSLLRYLLGFYCISCGVLACCLILFLVFCFTCCLVC